MPRNRSPYRNKMKTPCKTNARITLDLIEANEKKETTFNANSYIGSAPATPDPDSILHDVLSETHEDSAPSAPVLGDVITAQGKPTPLWTALAKGADGQILTMLGADDPGWADNQDITHTILDGDVHSDSVADAVTRGSLIVGNATPKWDELGKGTEGQVLTMIDANDPGWADTGVFTSIGPNTIPVGEIVTIDCGAVTTDAIETYVDVCCRNINSAAVFKAVQSLVKVAGKVTYYWYIDTGDLKIKIYNDSEVDISVMVWFGSPDLVTCECPLFDVRTVAVNTAATSADKILYCTVGGITVTLYTAVGNTGRDLYIDNDSVGNVTVDGSGVETIENELTQTLTPDTSIHIYSTGAEWRII